MEIIFFCNVCASELILKSQQTKGSVFIRIILSGVSSSSHNQFKKKKKIKAQSSIFLYFSISHYFSRKICWNCFTTLGKNEKKKKSDIFVSLCVHTHVYVYFGLTAHESKKPFVTHLLEQLWTTKLQPQKHQLATNGICHQHAPSRSPCLLKQRKVKLPKEWLHAKMQSWF